MDSTFTLTTAGAVGNRMKKQTSCSSLRRSVSGMKNLLPLRLLSPSVPEKEFWSSLGPNSKSFAARRCSRATPAPLKVYKNPRKAFTNKYRDTPIYTEPGSPLFGRAYFTNDPLYHTFITPTSSPKRYGHPTQQQPRYTKKFSAGSTIYSHSRDLSQDSDFSEDSFISNTVDRSSGLSFQCAGNPQVVSEPEMQWPGDPPDERSCSISNVPKTVTQHSFHAFVEPQHSRMSSWLSDSSGFDSDEEMLSWATALAPAKAQVINLDRFSDQTLRIPPRSSSLGQVFQNPDLNDRESWMSFADTPPRSSMEKWDSDDFEDASTPPTWIGRGVDLAMQSPPLTPQHRLSLSDSSEAEWLSGHKKDQRYTSCSTPSQSSISEAGSRNSQCPSTAATTIELPIDCLDIISSLEDMTFDFPSTMLLLSTPCISHIRDALFPRPPSQQQPPLLQEPKTPGLSSKTSQNSFYNPPQQCTVQRRRTMRFPSISRKGVTNPRWGSKSSPNLGDTSVTPCPSYQSSGATLNGKEDMEALRHIFPQSSNTMRSALHAHLLSHIYISSLLSSLHQATHPLNEYHQYSSHISRKAASLLGLLEVDIINSYSDIGYLEYLQGELRRCIWALVSVMDDVAGKEAEERLAGGRGVNIVLLRSLEEVVIAEEVTQLF